MSPFTIAREVWHVEDSAKAERDLTCYLRIEGAEGKVDPAVTDRFFLEGLARLGVEPVSRTGFALLDVAPVELSPEAATRLSEEVAFWSFAARPDSAGA
jgi:hypothetical protein